MTAQYNSAISTNPLLSPTAYAAAAAPFSIDPTSMGTSAYPGALLGSGELGALGQQFTNDMSQDNSTGAVAFANAYGPQAAQLNNAQQAAQAATGVNALQYALGQQGAGLNRFNQARQAGLGTGNFLAELLGIA